MTTVTTKKLKRHAILSVWFLLIGAAAFAQNDSVGIPYGKYPIDDNITYKGGEHKLLKCLKKNLCYPQLAQKDSVGGTVYVYFTIDTNGHSNDIVVIKGVREDLDNEAIRCVDLLDEWNVGKQNGRKVKSHHNIPIKFSLTDNPKRMR